MLGSRNWECSWSDAFNPTIATNVAHETAAVGTALNVFSYDAVYCTTVGCAGVSMMEVWHRRKGHFTTLLELNLDWLVLTSSVQQF